MAEAAAARVEVLRRRGLGGRFAKGLFRFIRRKPLGALGLFIVVGMVLIAVLAPWISPNSPLKFHPLHLNEYSFPSGRFFMGTDYLGRDVTSRIFHGARVSLMIAFMATFLGTGIGAVIGVFSGYVGGRFDMWIQRLMDVLLAFPGLVLALAVIAALGPSTTNVVLAIFAPIIPRANRVVRSSALAIKEFQFIDAARSIGAGNLRIMARHVAPNCTAPWLIVVTGQLGTAIIIEASLSFLGLGTQEPNPSWGAMLSGTAATFVRTAPWLSIFPGLFLSVTVFGFNVLGDALRDVLDPRLRRG